MGREAEEDEQRMVRHTVNATKSGRFLKNSRPLRWESVLETGKIINSHSKWPLISPKSNSLNVTIAIRKPVILRAADRTSNHARVLGAGCSLLLPLISFLYPGHLLFLSSPNNLLFISFHSPEKLTPLSSDFFFFFPHSQTGSRISYGKIPPL